MRLLLVDDHILFQEGLIGLIDSQPDFTVVGSAYTVKEGIEKACRLKPDIILMDFMLPDGTGLDAVAAILSDLPNVKIVFLTVHDEDERLFKAIRYGAKGYLLKNIPFGRLISYLRGLDKGEAAITPKFTMRILEEFSHTPSRTPPATEIISGLTDRQREVLHELVTGASNRQIAERLVISENTVKKHVSNILNELNLKNRQEVVEFSRKHNLYSCK